MRYLLDTNALLYIFSAPSELSARARRIARGESDLSVSVVSFWEIAIKQSIGKLQFGMTIPKQAGTDPDIMSHAKSAK